MTPREAYDEIMKRGWGIVSQMGGMIAVGPYRGELVEVWGMDNDPVRALEKALETEKRKGQATDPNGTQ